MQAIAEIGDYIAYDGNAGTILHEGETFTDSGFSGSEFRSNSGTAINIVSRPNSGADIFSKTMTMRIKKNVLT